MSAILPNKSLRINGRRYEITPIRRYLDNGWESKKGETSDDGLCNYYANPEYHPLFPWDVDGGLIIGEGDVGKSWYVDMMAAEDCPERRVRCLKLRSYIGDNKSLFSDAKSFWSECDDTRCTSELVLDGLDENESAWPTIADICSLRSDPDRQRVWITSRFCDAVRMLEHHECVKGKFHLLPFSKEDIIHLAEMVEIDGKDFLRALKLSSATAFAAKPGGAIMLLGLYAEGKLGKLSRVKLIEELVKGLSRGSRDGCPVLAASAKYSDERLLDAAGWIATRLFFENRKNLFLGVSADCPQDALAYDEVSTGAYAADMIKAVTSSRLFEPLSETLLRFTADAVLQPFLVACWLNRHAPDATIIDYFPSDVVIGDTTSSVLKWMALYKPELACRWVSASPQSFLSCPETIRLFGYERFYDAASSKFSELAREDRQGFFSGDEHQLDGNVTLAKVALNHLKSARMTPASVEYATGILCLTGLFKEEMSKFLVDYIARRASDLTPADILPLANCLAELSAEVNLRCDKLKTIIKRYDRNVEACIGVKWRLLCVLWPRYLSNEELRSLTRENTLEPLGLNLFTRWTLSDSFKATGDRSKIKELCRTALNHERDTTIFDMVCQSVVELAWANLSDPDLAESLFECFFVPTDEDERPFAFRIPNRMYDFYTDEKRLELISQDRAQRFALLNVALSHDECFSEDGDCKVKFGDYNRLVVTEDFDELYGRWARLKAQGDEKVAKRLAVGFLKELAALSDGTKCQHALKNLFAEYPVVSEFDPINRPVRLPTPEQRKAAELNAMVRSKLTGPWSPSLHAEIAAIMHKSPDRLDDDTRRDIIDVARKMVLECNYEADESKRADCAVAAIMLWSFDRKFLQGLTSETWHRIILFSINMGSPSGYERDFHAMLAWAHAKFRDSCDSAAVEVLCRECSKGGDCRHALNNYGLWLNDRIMSKTLECLPNDGIVVENVITSIAWASMRGHRFKALDRLLRELTDVTDFYEVDSHLYSAAMVINPDMYAKDFIRHLECDPPEKMKDWLGAKGTTLQGIEQALNAINDAGPSVKLFCWLCLNYDVKSFEMTEVDYQHDFPEEYVLSFFYDDLKRRLAILAPECAIAIIDEALKSGPNPHLSNLRTLIAEKVARRSPPRKIHGDELYALCVANEDKAATRQDIDEAVRHLEEHVPDLVIEKQKNKGGRPRKSDDGGCSLTQGEMAMMFGPPCNKSMVSNWERFVRTNGKQGAEPPSARIDGTFVSYNAELRKSYVGENIEILAEIIQSFKSREAVKTAAGASNVVHNKSDESLYRMQHPDGKVRTGQH